MPTFSSIETQVRSLRSPRLPSSFTRYLGMMKQEIPLVPGGDSGVRARVMWMMFSVRSCSPQVTKILVPVMR